MGGVIAREFDPPALYNRVLGADFDQLPQAVRILHDLTAPTVWTGRVDVYRGGSRLARLAGRLMGLPPAGYGMPLHVTFTPDGKWFATAGWDKVIRVWNLKPDRLNLPVAK